VIYGTVVGHEGVIAKVKGLNQTLRGELKKSIWRIVLRLQRHVKEGKLSGQVLHVRSGTLRRSIHADVQDNPASVIGRVGTNVRYARVHEFGFEGPVAIKAHLRMMKQAWGKPVREPRKIQVQAHSRQVKLPVRSFLRSALFDMAPQIRDEFTNAVANTVRAAQ